MIFERWGSNLQNVKKEMRQIYIPDGYDPHDKGLEERLLYFLKTGDTTVFTEEELLKLRIFLQADQSGAEALIMAYLCEKGNYRLLFENGIKVHCYVCMKLFPEVWQEELKNLLDFQIDDITNLPIPELKKSPYWKPLDTVIRDSDHWPTSRRYYYFGKQTCHSANYDVGEFAFRMNTLEKSGGKVVFSKEQGIYFLTTYRSLFPEIPERNRKVAWEVEHLGIIYNIFGFPCQITGYNIPESVMKEHYAWSPQSSVGEITRIAFSRMQEYIEQENKPFDLLADTHDSYLVQCPLTHVRECRDKMSEFMNQEMVSPVDGTHFRMRSECKVGFNWNDSGPDNLVGLQELKWN